MWFLSLASIFPAVEVRVGRVIAGRHKETEVEAQALAVYLVP